MALVFLLGGARSGKSALALALIERSSAPVTFIATAEPLDAELTARIARHRAERPPSWQTIEEPLEIRPELEALPPDSAVVIDCLTLWVANLLARGADEESVVALAVAVADLAATRRGPVVVVSNEVGSGIVPADAATRSYRDALGRVNVTFAARAETAFLVVAGRLLRLEEAGAVALPGVMGRR